MKMNTLDPQYQLLLEDIIDSGTVKETRNGKTISVFGRQIRHRMSNGFPLLTSKKMAWKSIVTELIWILRGDTNIKYLVDNGCNIWTGDAYKKYFDLECLPPHDHSLSKSEFIEQIKTNEKFAEKWGELGPVYGAQWRDWIPQEDYSYGAIDQIENLINDLKTNPDSRRMMVNAWNVGDLCAMTLPPCHYGFQVYTRELTDKERYDFWFTHNYETGMERWFDPNNLPAYDDNYYTPTPTRSISLMFNCRSVDVPLGLPFNIASYGLLLEILAKECNMVAGELIGNLGDCHIYANQMEGVKEQIKRDFYDLPKLDIKLHFDNDPSFTPEYWLSDDFQITDYNSEPKINFPLSN